MKRMWQEIGKKKRLVIENMGGGIHTGLPPTEIPIGLATDMQNLHTGSYPHLRPRPPRSTAAVPALPTGTLRFFGVCVGEKLCAVIGDTLYVLQNRVWKSFGQLFSSTTGRIHATDFMGYTIFADGITCKRFNGEEISAVSKSGSPGPCAFLATNAWHLFAASEKDNYLRYSAVEDMTDWTAPGDAGQELIETAQGAFGSALTSYGGHILYFKKNAIFELYGTDPVNFSLLPISGDIGCAAAATITEVDGRLYFLGRDGVYTYSGGARPTRISFPVQRFIDNAGDLTLAAAGSDGVRYYLALPQVGGKTVVLVYDTRINAWFSEDNVPFFAFARTTEGFFAAAVDGTVYAFGVEGTETVTWSYTSRPYLCENSLFQNWHRLYIRAEVANGAHYTVAVSPWLSGEGFSTVGEITQSGLVQIELPTRFFGAPHLRFRLSGAGDVTISTLEVELRGRERSYI